MKSNTKLMLGIASGVAIGGTIGYLLATSKRGLKAIEDVEQKIEDSNLRIPDPSFAMEVPYTEDQFGILDQLVCECGEPVIQDADPQATLDSVSNAIRDCMATKLYPQFPWPPVSGDHPSVSQLYNELGVLARRAVATSEICPIETP